MRKIFIAVLAGVILGISGNIFAQGELWGTASNDGVDSLGTLFKIHPDGTGYTIAYEFSYENPGAYPGPHLIEISPDVYLGTAAFGGLDGRGVIYAYEETTGTYTVLFHFKNTADLSSPYSLVKVDENTFYGVCAKGTYGDGAIFKYILSTSQVTKLADLNSSITGHGLSQLTYADGALHGTTPFGATYGYGAWLEYNIGSGTLTKRLDFDGDLYGTGPYVSPTLASNGKLYAFSNGINNIPGKLLEYDPVTQTFNLKLDLAMENGVYPQGQLIEVSPGVLLGADNSYIFEYNYISNTIERKLILTSNNGNLTPGPDNKFYGTCHAGGLNDGGFLYAYDYVTNTYEKKFEFAQHQEVKGLFYASIGSRLLLASNGKLYGTTQSGEFSGALFEYNISSGIFTRRFYFNYSSFGAEPYGGLMQAGDGKLYGVTRFGGASNLGVLFQFDPTNGALTKKVDFSPTSGSKPMSCLTEAANGKLYGMTTEGGLFNYGALFEFDPATNTFEKKVDFSGTDNGGYAKSKLAQSSEGKLFGMTVGGGTQGSGVIFEYDPTTSILTKRFDFDRSTSAGGFPQGDLALASDGMMYGITSEAVVNYYQGLFRFDPGSRVFSWRRIFPGLSPFYSGLATVTLQESGTLLYGMEPYGGNFNGGMIFQYDRLSENDSIKFFFSFDPSTGTRPTGSFTQLPNGKLYALTTQGGNNNAGTLIEFDPGAKTVAKKFDFPSGLIKYSRSPSLLFVSSKVAPVLAFNLPNQKRYSDHSFIIPGTSTSPTTIVYTSSDPSIASISGNVVTIHKLGKISITATQAENASFQATTKTHALVITKGVQVLNINPLEDVAISHAPITLSGSSSAGLPLTFYTLGEQVTVTGTKATLVRPGRAWISASQAGNELYEAAVPISSDFCVFPEKPIITFELFEDLRLLRTVRFMDYKWFFNGELMPSEVMDYVIPAQEGTYQVQVSLDGCNSELSDGYHYVVTATEPTQRNSIQLYPNPAESFVVVSGLTVGNHVAWLFTPDGRESRLLLIQSGTEHRAAITDLPAGIYLLNVGERNSGHFLRFIKK